MFATFRDFWETNSIISAYWWWGVWCGVHSDFERSHALQLLTAVTWWQSGFSAVLFLLQLSLSSWTWRHWNLCDTLCGCSGTEVYPSMSWLITVGYTNPHWWWSLQSHAPVYYILNLFLSRSWDHDGSWQTDRGWLWVPLGPQLPEPLPADQLAAWSAEEVRKTGLLL